MKKLIFIDDDRDFLESTRIYFTKKGYNVSCSDTPEEALNILASANLDCIILDIDMPHINGFELCRRLRETSSVPVIFLSGYSDTQNRILSFQSGGDDFLAKPFDILELELRIEARIRKNESVFYSDVLHYGKLCIDPNRRIVSYDGSPVDLSALQFDILFFLASNPGNVFSYEQLYDRVWKTPIVKSRHNLQVTIATIRQKLLPFCEGRQYIRTVSRKGYYFMDDCEPDETADSGCRAD